MWNKKQQARAKNLTALPHCDGDLHKTSHVGLQEEGMQAAT
jgi:alkyl hydroperoxide reductase subunit AhpF